MKEKILILDANSILYRAFHALPPLTDKDGNLINGLYGFLLVFLRVAKEFKPDYIVACFDFPAPTFRHQQFKDYKAGRPPTPKELVFQILKTKEILQVFSTTVLEERGYEADDLIGTLVERFPDKEKIIVSGDSDILQLINKTTKIYLLKKGVKEITLYDEEKIKKEIGLDPKQIIDYKSLVGDPSDNVPGVKGIGKKTAIELIKKFGSLEKIYEEIEKGEISEKIRKKLLEEKQQVFFGKKILEIKKDVPINIELKKFQEYKEEEIINTLKQYGFKSLLSRISQLKENRLF